MQRGDRRGDTRLAVDRGREGLVGRRRHRLRQRARAPERHFAFVRERVDGFAIQPGVEVHVRRPERERHQRIEPAVARKRDRFAARDDLPLAHECTGQVRRRRHQAAAVVDEDLQSAAVEFADDAHDLAGRCGQHPRSDGNREVGAVVAVVGEVATAEIQHLGLAHRPSELDRSLPMVEEVGDDRAPGNEESAAPEGEGDARLELLQARQVEATRRHVLLATNRDERLRPTLAPRVQPHGFGEEPELRFELDFRAHENSTQRDDAAPSLRRERAP